jgi:Domain of unknown function (DUF4189)
MSKMTRSVAVVAASIALLTATIGGADAAGALAVGACGAYGYGFDYTTEASARVAAISKCSNGKCQIVGTLHRACAAMSVDAKNPCGSFGWAIDSHLGKAENISVCRCLEYGGHDCVIRAWACDQKG